MAAPSLFERSGKRYTLIRQRITDPITGGIVGRTIVEVNVPDVSVRADRHIVIDAPETWTVAMRLRDGIRFAQQTIFTGRTPR